MNRRYEADTPAAMRDAAGVLLEPFGAARCERCWAHRVGGAPAPPVCQRAIRRHHGWRSGFSESGRCGACELVVPGVGPAVLRLVELLSQAIPGLPDEVGDLS